MSLFDTGVIPVINDWLAEKAKEERDYGDYWSASSAGYCMRKNIFERLKVPPVEEDARKHRLFASGHIFHSWAQEITKEAGVSIAQELELIDDDLMIKGHFDDLVLIDDKLILYDIKTAHSKWFEYVKDRPMSYYNKLQLGTYMYMLRNNAQVFANAESKNILPTHDGTLMPVNLENLTEARILKISKDDLRMHEQQLMWSDVLEQEVKDYWSSINEFWTNKEIPPCTCADYEINSKTKIGFMADPRYNPYFYDGHPCSLKWYRQWREKNA